MDRPARGTSIVATAMALAVMGAMTTAAAEPAPTNPIPTTSTSGLTAAADGSAVLIVHTSGGTHALRADLAGSRTRVRHDFGVLHALSVQVRAADVSSEIARLQAMPGVTSVERAVQRTFTGAATTDPGLAKQQSYLDAVQAPTAWKTQHASPAIKIAIVDSGIDVGHPDLQNKIVGTYNAADPTNPAITDEVGHGTFVAGVAAAQTNNGVGVAGAGYNAAILGVKVAAADGSITIDDEVAGIKWAANHGADIINLSLGGPDYSSAERSAVAYAQSKGALVVAAAGNDATSAKSYPAAYPGVVAVGAVDTATHTRASFSNFGAWVTLAGPGVGIYSTTPRAGSEFFPNKTGYGTGDGTSFASPIVAGEAALLKAQNPTMSLSRLRASLVGSAHGYTTGHVGAGLVDFARGLAHVPPNSTPADLTPQGTSNTIHVVATSTAPKVALRIDSSPFLPAVPVVNGQADINLASWGFANGPHTLYAVDCTAYGECNTSAATAAVDLENTAAVLTTPAAGATVTGRFTVQATHPGGGALRLLMDDTVEGFDKSAPYTFTLSASGFRDAPHTMRVQLCSLNGRNCSSPESATVTMTSVALHPKIAPLDPLAISPNGDGAKDAGTLAFSLPDVEAVRVEVSNAHGTVVRSAGLGALGAGPHSWIWHGRSDDGSRVPDGAYSLALSTSHDGVRGWVSRPGRVDTAAPTLAHPTGAGAVVYPYRDGYRDTFTTRTILGERGTLTLTVRTSTGRLVRKISAARARGRAAITWGGYDNQGHWVAAGTYQWQLAVTDASGNRRLGSTYRLRLSGQRLTPETVGVSLAGDRFDSAGVTASCATARVRPSRFAHGIRLVNACPARGFEIAFAQYTFTLPRALRYTRITVRAYGHSLRVPSEITAAFLRTDGGIEIPGYLKVARTGDRWHTIASVPASAHVNSSRQVQLTFILDSYYANTNDFDLARAKIRVGIVVLR
jgi:subtilisin family serine protease/flagellar hook assembly protein FlgD